MVIQISVSIDSVVLLPYSFNTQALTNSTTQTIHGHAPYLTFDSGVTKVDTTWSVKYQVIRWNHNHSSKHISYNTYNVTKEW